MEIISSAGVFLKAQTASTTNILNFGLFELPLTLRVQIFGFQDQEAWTIVENEERSVRYWYVSTYNVFTENIRRKRTLSLAFKIRRRVNFHEVASSSKSYI